MPSARRLGHSISERALNVAWFLLEVGFKPPDATTASGAPGFVVEVEDNKNKMQDCAEKCRRFDN